MTGRRRHTRLSTTNAEGILRLPADVVIEAQTSQEIIAICHTSYAVGERLVIETVADHTRRAVEVVDSRPVMVARSVRYRVRLALAD